MLDYITLHWGEFSALGAALMIVGGIVVKLTPTKTDDAWWRALMEGAREGGTMRRDRIHRTIDLQLFAAILAALLWSLPVGLSCAAIGQAKATPEQKFYEADTAALVALQAVAPAVIAVGPDKIPEKLKIALLGAAKSLKTLRTEARAWMTECGPESGCER